MGWKLVEATDPVPKGRNNQEPGTEVPGRHNQRIESRKGRHSSVRLVQMGFLHDLMETGQFKKLKFYRMG